MALKRSYSLSNAMSQKLSLLSSLLRFFESIKVFAFLLENIALRGFSPLEAFTLRVGSLDWREGSYAVLSFSFSFSCFLLIYT